MSVSPIQVSLLGYVVQLARPDRAWLVAVAVSSGLILAFGAYARLRALRTVARSGRLAFRLTGGVSPSRIVAKGALGAAGLVLLSLALLRPQVGEKPAVAKAKGIDLVVALDASRSMLARDVLPSRLDRAKLELSALFDRLQGDRVGLVAFAGEAFVQCPLTSDHGAAKLFLRAIDPESMPAQGTALAAALDTAAGMFRAADHGATTKVVLLLTDGEDHDGRVAAAAARLAEEGVRIFTVGIGSASGTPIPVLDRAGRVAGYRKDRDGRTVITRLEEGPLRDLAAATSGRYVAGVGSDMGLGEIAAELDKLEKSEREGHSTVEYGEAFPFVAGPGFAFLVVAALVGERRRGS
ncbi:MAG TPA: VWA domain-containing protein [Vulgatibacter sp.]